MKAAIHPPRPPEFPDWERHWGFDENSKSEVAHSAKCNGGRHKATWSGYELHPGLTLEWRIIFTGTALLSKPIAVEDDVTLLPVPKRGYEIQIVVMLGEAGKTISIDPAEQGSLIYQIGESLPDNRQTWILALRVRQDSREGVRQRGEITELPNAKFHTSQDLADWLGERRVTLAGVQQDGSLLFLDARAELKSDGKVTIQT